MIKHLILLKSPKYNGYQRGLASNFDRKHLVEQLKMVICLIKN